MGVQPLTGMRVLSLAVNLPGPLAASRLRDAGASILKVEPPWGDPMERYAPAWYAELHRDVTVERLDLHAPDGREHLDGLLEPTDLLLVSSRPASRIRLGTDFDSLHARHPRLCSVALVGDPDDPEAPGHDLTYQASAGLVHPSSLPRVLLADMVAGERAAAKAFAVLLARERDGEGREATVSVQEAAEACATPVRLGLTVRGGLLGGGSDRYGIYRARDGWIAVAALEDHFWDRLRREAAKVVGVERVEWDGVGEDEPSREGSGMDGDPADGTADAQGQASEDGAEASGGAGVSAEEADLLRIFTRRSPDWWEAWARERQLPVVAIPRQW